MLTLVLLAWLLLACIRTGLVSAQESLEWTEPVVISSQLEHAGQPTLVADPRGVVHVFWSSQRSQTAGSTESEPEAILYARHEAGKWTQPADILLSPGGAPALYSRSILDSSGRLHLFWSAPDVDAFGPLYHSWAPADEAMDARSWQPPAEIAAGTYQGDVALDPQGGLHLVYASVTDGAGICHVLSEDNGDTWSSRSCIPHAATVRQEEHEVRPRLAIDSQGVLHVVWVLDDLSPASRLRYSGRAVFYARSTDAGLTWSDMIAVDEVDSRDDGYLGLQPEWGNVAVDREDRVHVVWIGSPDMQRYHQWSDDGGLNWNPRHVASPSRGYNNWFGMAVDGGGTLHLVFPSLEGVEYTYWTGDRWAPPLLLEGTEGAHYAQAAIALGSQLHAVWQDHGGDTRGGLRGQIRYAMKQTGAPAEEPRPLPVPRPTIQPTPTVWIVETREPAHTPLALPTFSESELAATVSDSRVLLLASLAPVAALVGLVFLFRRWRT